MGRILSPGKNSANHDLVFTPIELAINVIKHFTLSGKVLDPAKGMGAFYDNLPSHVERYWCEIEQGIDFFAWTSHVDWIITNPPWSKMRAFLNKGMEISDNIVYLAPVNHFITKARLRDIYTSGFKIHEIYCVSTPKINWPQSGFQLAAVHLTKTDVGLSNIMINGEIGK